MVLTLEVDRIESGCYRAAALSGGIAVTESAVYASIAEAIREEVAAVPPGFAHFAEVSYGGASSGTIALQTLLERASQVADELVALVAEMRRIEDS